MHSNHTGQYTGQIIGTQKSVYPADPAATMPVERERGLIAQLNDQLTGVLKAVHESTARARSTADRVIGPQPEEVMKGANEAVSDPPALRRIEDTIGYLTVSVEELQHQIVRLQRL